MFHWFTILLAATPLARGEFASRPINLPQAVPADSARAPQMLQLQPRISSTNSSVATIETAIDPIQPSRLE